MAGLGQVKDKLNQNPPPCISYTPFKGLYRAPAAFFGVGSKVFVFFLSFISESGGVVGLFVRLSFISDFIKISSILAQEIEFQH